MERVCSIIDDVPEEAVCTGIAVVAMRSSFRMEAASSGMTKGNVMTGLVGRKVEEDDAVPFPSDGG